MANEQVDTITEKLINRSDEKLKKEIIKKFEYIISKTSYKGNVMFSLTNDIIVDDRKITMPPSVMIKVLKDFIFEKHHKQWRQAEINQFMRQVESLRNDVDELYNEINN